MPYGGWGGQTTGLAGLRGLSQIAPPSPEDEWGVLDTGLTALQTIGQFLDTPGSGVRALLTGRNPFTAMFNPAERISGYDMLKEWGLNADNDWLDVPAGLLAEVVTDPLTLIEGPFGATTKAGRALEKTGALKHIPIHPTSGKFLLEGGEQVGKREFLRKSSINSLLKQVDAPVAQEIGDQLARNGVDLAKLGDSPLRQGIGFHIPFTDVTHTRDLPWSARADKAKDWVGEGIRGSWLGTGLHKLFNKHVRDTGNSSNPFGKATQRIVEQQDIISGEDTGFLKAGSGIIELNLKRANLDTTDPDVLSRVRAVKERANPKGGMFPTYDEAIDHNFPGATTDQRLALTKAASYWRDIQDEAQDNAIRAGINTQPFLSDHAEWSSRHNTDPSYQKHTKERSLHTRTEGRRAPESAFVWGGTRTEEAAIQDKKLTDLLMKDKNNRLYDDASTDQLQDLASAWEKRTGQQVNLADWDMADLTNDHIERMTRTADRLSPGMKMSLEEMRTQIPAPFQKQLTGAGPLRYILENYYHYTDDAFTDIASAQKTLDLHAQGAFESLTKDELRALQEKITAHKENIVGSRYLGRENLERHIAGENITGGRFQNHPGLDATTSSIRLNEMANAAHAGNRQLGATLIRGPGGGVVPENGVPIREGLARLGHGSTPTSVVYAIRDMAKNAREFDVVGQSGYDMIAGTHPQYGSNLKRFAKPEDYAAFEKYQGKLAKENTFKGGAKSLDEALANLNDPQKALRTADQINHAAESARGINKAIGAYIPKVRKIAENIRQGLPLTTREIDTLKLFQSEMATTDAFKVFKRETDALTARMLEPHVDGLLDLNNLFFDKRALGDVTGYLDSFNSRAMSPLLEKYDKWMATFKNNVTFPWFGYLFRNRYGGLHQHMASGGHDPTRSGMMKYLGPIFEAKDVLAGGTIKNLARDISIFKGLTDAQATDQLRSYAAAFNTASDLALHSPASDISSVAAQLKKLHSIADTMPGMNPANIGPFGIKAYAEGIRDTLKGHANPLNVPGGLMDNPATQFGMTKAGIKVSNHDDSMFRLATMIGKMKQGFNPAEAAAHANAAHVPYDKLSRFEQKMVKRVIPFYSYSRFMVPWTIKNLMEKPGGLVAQEIRAFNRLGEDKEGFTPPEIAKGLGIKLPFGDDKISSYLTQVDLPFESLNDLASFGGGVTGSLEKTARTVASQSAPWAKLALESAFGRSLHSGRNLDEVPSTIGQIIGNLKGDKEPAIAPSGLERMLLGTVLSPASRAISTVRQLTDTRSGDPVEYGLRNISNLTTGARVRQVDTEDAKLRAMAEIARKSLIGRPGVASGEYIGAKKDVELDPDTQKRLDLYRGVQQMLRTKAEEKKRAR